MSAWYTPNPYCPERPIPVRVGDQHPAPDATIAVLSGDADGVKIGKDGIAFTRPGIFRLRLTAGLHSLEATITAVERAAIDRIDLHVNPNLFGSNDTLETRRHNILFSLVAHSAFDGTLESLLPIRLVDHGGDQLPKGGAIRVR